MSFVISTQSELLKTKRTASFWLSILGAAFVPTIYFILFITNSEEVKDLAASADPWKRFFFTGWQILSFFLLPMYIILISTLIPQIEFRNNTWKQVFASPQSMGNIFFSKFATIHLMILSCFLLFNILMVFVAVMGNLINPSLPFFHKGTDISMLIQVNLKAYIAVLGISAIQYALALRFKTFIVPIGIGLALVIGSIIAVNLHWKHMHKYPYAFPLFSVDSMKNPNRPFILNTEWNSIGYFAVFTLIGFFDMKFRKEKG